MTNYTAMLEAYRQYTIALEVLPLPDERRRSIAEGRQRLLTQLVAAGIIDNS
jgi:hypothetical protein